jgi:glycosyltransferase involved in cell wall biosynthesis
MHPEISVVIPAYNASKYLKESVSSVKAQSFRAWELIIVDDGSTDNTAEIAQEFLSDERIHLIRQTNKGVSAARNAGIKTAKGKYVAFLDADDSFLKDNLQRKYEILEKDSRIDFVYSDVFKCDEHLNKRFIEHGVEPEKLFEKALLWETETISCLPSNLIIKNSKLSGDLLFDENLSNCADRYMKIMLGMHLKGYHIPEPLANYRDTPGSMSKKVFLLEHDEKYIIEQIKNRNLIPSGKFRRKVIASIYVTLSGSWYTDAQKPLKALYYGIKASFIYPLSLPKLVKKLFF